ncbi:MAG: hypothetical protein CMI75_08390 [Candidatus Pelagibacter sp.]|nr:hypothetical protein [Candidatus Pelagibacter sp.]|tara:strand:- start:566 stop:1012 length:447 start_codon:yes stop_codon:yes gene_type:complete
MNIEQLRNELTQDEGCKLEIYRDHLGYPTCGIGHLITDFDEELFGQPEGTPVSQEKVNELFERDIQITLNECNDLYNNFDVLPEEVQHIIANMMFNMGKPRLSRFVNMKKAVLEGDWKEASVQMQDSKWYQQVPNRAGRLVTRMKDLS